MSGAFVVPFCNRETLKREYRNTNITKLLTYADNLRNNYSSRVYILPKAYINNTEGWGATIKFGQSEVGNFVEDTYWLCVDNAGKIAIGVQVNGWANPTWYVK